MGKSRYGLAVVLLPPLVTLIVLFVLPIASMAAYSFWSVDNNYQLVTDPTLGQYQKVFSSGIYWDTLFNSAAMAFFTTLVCAAIAVPLAWAIVRNFSVRMRILLIVGLILPGWISVLIRTYSMLIIIRDEGLVNIALQKLGIIDQPLVILYTDFAVGLGLLYSYLPFMVLPIYASLEKVDFRLVEAGFDLYASRFRVLRRIIIPLAKPGIIAGCILVFIPALGAYITPIMLGGGKNLMIGNLISLQFGSSRNWPFGSAAALILMAFVMIALMFYVRTTTGEKAHRHG